MLGIPYTYYNLAYYTEKVKTKNINIDKYIGFYLFFMRTILLGIPDFLKFNLAALIICTLRFFPFLNNCEL